MAGLLPELMGALGVGGMLTAGVTGFFLWRSTRPSQAKDSADLVTAAAAFQAAMNKAAESMVADLRKEIDALRKRVEELEEENEICRREAEALRQGGRQMEQKIQSLMSVLRQGGVDIPGGGLADTVIELTSETVTVLRPERVSKARS